MIKNVNIATSAIGTGRLNAVPTSGVNTFLTLRTAKADESARGTRAHNAQADFAPISLGAFYKITASGLVTRILE